MRENAEEDVRVGMLGVGSGGQVQVPLFHHQHHIVLCACFLLSAAAEIVKVLSKVTSIVHAITNQLRSSNHIFSVQIIDCIMFVSR